MRMVVIKMMFSGEKEEREGGRKGGGEREAEGNSNSSKP